MWARRKLTLAVGFGLACCAIEMMLHGSSAPFTWLGSERKYFGLLAGIAGCNDCAGRLSPKRLQCYVQLYDQMPDRNGDFDWRACARLVECSTIKPSCKDAIR